LPGSRLSPFRCRPRLALVLLGLVPFWAAAAGLVPATPQGPLSLQGAVRPTKPGEAVYLVKLKASGAANYKGGAPGYAATKPAPGKRFNATAGNVESYVRHIEASQDRLLAEVGASGTKLYSYRYAMNGFSARLTPEQVAALAHNSEVERIWPDSDQHLRSDDSAVFLGLENPSGGLRTALGLKGENIVIGVIDSGIAPNHPSLSDVKKHIPSFCQSQWAESSLLGKWLCGAIRRDPPTTLVYGPVQGFHGVCESGDGFPATACNNKIVGARYYIDGFLAEHTLDPNGFVSPKDADGHGTHVATTAAGNPTTATLFGQRIDDISGIAPRARIAVYKACWLTPGAVTATCTTSDLARAIDDAVADGVDLINYSVGSLETDLTAPDDMALLNAFDAGVLTVVAAGNDGPTPGTIGSPSSDPWVLTAGASTDSGTYYKEAIQIEAPKDMAGNVAMKEASFTPPLDEGKALKGQLVLVNDGVETLADGKRLIDALDDGKEVDLGLERGQFIENQESGYDMGSFSSRGPDTSEPDFVKPDVTAPGVNILAGATPDAANGVRGQWFQYMSGTSMSAPETVGVAALLKQAHPDWSPAMLKSALTTSANPRVYRADGETPAGPFDMGAGYIDPNKAIDPGLVYDSGFLDQAAYLCGLERPPFAPADCAVLSAAGYSSSPSELNLPSIGVSRLISGDFITRRVTNVSAPGTYTVSVEAPEGISVDVEPPSLTLGAGESANYSVTFTDNGATRDQWSFGRIVWSDGKHQVASPVAVQPVTLRAPEEVSLTGRSGGFSIPVAFGYTGSYTLGVHGLRKAYTEQGFVDQDPTRQFSFRFDKGVTAHFMNMPPDQLFARFALFDDATDGADDLDLYLFYCPNNQCTQIAQSGGFTSNERIDLRNPKPGLYAVLVHGFQTDPSNGEGANYTVYAWSVGFDDVVGNMQVEAPLSVTEGDRTTLDLEWAGLDAGARYLGALSHTTPDGLYGLTIVDIETP
jgi:subtilisin family serine protease